MAHDTRTAPPRDTVNKTGSLLLAAGGLAAAFAAASCCALPLLLGSLGIGSAWLIGIAILAAPHRAALLVGAVGCLAGAGALLAWHRHRIAGAPGAVCRTRPLAPLVVLLLVLGAALLLGGVLFA